MNYLLVLILVVVVCALIFTSGQGPDLKLTIKKCCICGSPAHLTGDFFDSHVQCSNRECAMTGPKRADENDAVTVWNTMFSKIRGRQS